MTRHDKAETKRIRAEAEELRGLMAAVGCTLIGWSSVNSCSGRKDGRWYTFEQVHLDAIRELVALRAAAAAKEVTA